MHEWSLAEAVIDAIINTINSNIDKSEKSRVVKKVSVLLGELQQIEIDIFDMALKELSNNTILKGVSFEIKEEKAAFRCRNCGQEWTMEDLDEKLKEDVQEAIHFIPEAAHTFMSCPNCGSPDFEVIRGRGVTVEEIILE